MKNLLKISITTLGTLAIIGTTAMAATGKVNAPSGLVLRDEASKSGNPITTVPDKAEVNIVEKNGEWYKVTYDSHEGYIFAEYVESDDAEISQTTTSQENEQTTNTNEQTAQTNEQTNIEDSSNVQAKNILKVYNLPLITSTVVNEIDANAQITIVKEIKNWTYISSGEIQGWVRTYGLENEVKPQQQPEETPVTEPETPVVEPEQPSQEEPTQPTISEQEVPKQENEEKTDEPSNTAQTETTVEVKKGFVSASNANIRKEASTDSDIVTVLSKDTSFTINAETEEWYKIKYTGVDGTVYEGYIYKPLVKF